MQDLVDLRMMVGVAAAQVKKDMGELVKLVLDGLLDHRIRTRRSLLQQRPDGGAHRADASIEGLQVVEAVHVSCRPLLEQRINLGAETNEDGALLPVTQVQFRAD
jgi:hypothetical protein